MNSPKNIALVALTLVAIGSAVLAWRQQMELQALRATALGGDERKELMRRTLAAESRAKQLEDELTVAREKLSEAKPVGAKTSVANRHDDAGEKDPSFRTVIAGAANAMNRPEMQRMMAMSQKAALDSNYAKLFKQMNLPPEKLDQLKKLMVERQTVGADVFTAAIQQGLDPIQNRREISKLSTDAQAKVDGEIKALLGDSDYAAYQNYNATLPQRGVVNQLQQSLSYTSSPLTETQADQLVQILAANPVARPSGATRIFTAPVGGAIDAGQNVTATRTMVFVGSAGSGGGDLGAPIVTGAPALIGGAQISEAAVAAARPVLSDPQYEALQQMQQQQAQLRSMMQQPGGVAMPVGGGVIRIESSTSTSSGTPQSAPAQATKPPGGG